MIIRKTDRKVKFDEINKIYFDNLTCKIVHSNHSRYKQGKRVDEAIRGNALGRGWDAVPLRYDKLQGEAISVDDLIYNIILAREDDGRFTVFESPDGNVAVFAQNQGDKVYAMFENGDTQKFNSVEEFLKSIPGYVLAGVVDQDEIEMEDEE
jgi:hypothetical protein